MRCLKFEKSALFFFTWPFMLWAYLFGRVFCINFLKISLCIALTFGTHFKSALHSNEVPKTPWVVDEHQMLSPAVSAGITNVLAESARKRNVHVRVLVLQNASQELADMEVKRKVMEWENKDRSLELNKTVYFIIHVIKGESEIILGNSLQKNASFHENVQRIQNGIIQPILATGNIEKAVTEGVVALVTVLEELPVRKPSMVALSVERLQHYHLLTPLKFLSIFFLLALIWSALKWYLRRPDWDEITQIDINQSLEEKMLLESFPYKEKPQEDAYIQ